MSDGLCENGNCLGDRTTTNTRLDDRQLKGVRLRADLIEQINIARQERGVTFQVYVQMALSRQLDEDRARRESAKQENSRAAGGSRPEARGLGVRDRLSKSASRTASDSADDSLIDLVPTPPPTTNVTVHVTTPGTAVRSDITALARGIVERPRNERRAALLDACTKLAGTASSEEERLSLATMLDTEIARLNALAPRTVHERVMAQVRSRLAQR